MKRLNLRTPKAFDYTDEYGNTEQRTRFFCVAEGPTEESYFEGIRNNKRFLNIKSDVIIEVVPKEEGQETYSHPMQLVNACIHFMGRCDDEGNELPEEEWEKHCKWDYKPDIDTVCVIFDRDYRDLEKHLVSLHKLCDKHNISVIMSNPNFELWLLMHFPGIEKYDREILLSNPKNLRKELFPEASKNKKYLEIMVSKQAEGYSKGRKIKFEQFKPFINLAIEQVGLFCEDAKKLDTELGTAVGGLIKKMMA